MNKNSTFQTFHPKIEVEMNSYFCKRKTAEGGLSPKKPSRVHKCTRNVHTQAHMNMCPCAHVHGCLTSSGTPPTHAHSHTHTRTRVCAHCARTCVHAMAPSEKMALQAIFLRRRKLAWKALSRRNGPKGRYLRDSVRTLIRPKAVLTYVRCILTPEGR